MNLFKDIYNVSNERETNMYEIYMKSYNKHLLDASNKLHYEMKPQRNEKQRYVFMTSLHSLFASTRHFMTLISRTMIWNLLLKKCAEYYGRMNNVALFHNQLYKSLTSLISYISIIGEGHDCSKFDKCRNSKLISYIFSDCLYYFNKSNIKKIDDDNTKKDEEIIKREIINSKLPRGISSSYNLKIKYDDKFRKKNDDEDIFAEIHNNANTNNIALIFSKIIDRKLHDIKKSQYLYSDLFWLSSDYNIRKRLFTEFALDPHISNKKFYIDHMIRLYSMNAIQLWSLSSYTRRPTMKLADLMNVSTHTAKIIKQIWHIYLYNTANGFIKKKKIEITYKNSESILNNSYCSMQKIECAAYKSYGKKDVYTSLRFFDFAKYDYHQYPLMPLYGTNSFGLSDGYYKHNDKDIYGLLQIQLFEDILMRCITPLIKFFMRRYTRCNYAFTWSGVVSNPMYKLNVIIRMFAEPMLECLRILCETGGGLNIKLKCILDSSPLRRLIRYIVTKDNSTMVGIDTKSCDEDQDTVDLWDDDEKPTHDKIDAFNLVIKHILLYIMGFSTSPNICYYVVNPRYYESHPLFEPYTKDYTNPNSIYNTQNIIEDDEARVVKDAKTEKFTSTDEVYSMISSYFSTDKEVIDFLTMVTGYRIEYITTEFKRNYPNIILADDIKLKQATIHICKNLFDDTWKNDLRELTNLFHTYLLEKLPLLNYNRLLICKPYTPLQLSKMCSTIVFGRIYPELLPAMLRDAETKRELMDKTNIPYGLKRYYDLESEADDTVAARIISYPHDDINGCYVLL